MVSRFPTLKQIRIENYQFTDDSGSEHGIDVNNFLKNPYTFLKVKYYIELSSLVVYVFLRSNITANQTTFIYIFVGVLGSMMISIGDPGFTYVGCVLIFNKSVFDWADGAVARWTDTASMRGAIFDSYGARVTSVAFYSALGLYCYSYEGDIYFLILTVLFCLVNGLMVTHYAPAHILSQIVQNKITVKNNTNFPQSKLAQSIEGLPKGFFGNVIRRFSFLISVFDDRARSVDLIILTLLCETYFGSYQIIKYVFLFVVFRSLLIYVADLYGFFKGSWIDRYHPK